MEIAERVSELRSRLSFPLTAGAGALFLLGIVIGIINYQNRSSRGGKLDGLTLRHYVDDVEAASAQGQSCLVGLFGLAGAPKPPAFVEMVNLSSICVAMSDCGRQ